MDGVGGGMRGGGFMFNGQDMSVMMSSPPLPPEQGRYSFAQDARNEEHLGAFEDDGSAYARAGGAGMSAGDGQGMYAQPERNYGLPLDESILPPIHRSTPPQQPAAVRKAANRRQQAVARETSRSAGSRSRRKPSGSRGHQEALRSSSRGHDDVKSLGSDSSERRRTPDAAAVADARANAHDLHDPKMSADFYNGVEDLLAAPPPTLKGIMKHSSKKGIPNVSVEQMKRERSNLRKAKGASSAGAKTTGGTRRSGGKPTSRGSNASAGASAGHQGMAGGHFNYHLLAEAMQYVQRIQGEGMQEIAEDLGHDGQQGALNQAGLARGSPPRQGQAANGLRRKKSAPKMKSGNGKPRALSVEQKAAYAHRQRKKKAGHGGKRSSWSSEHRKGEIEDDGRQVDMDAMVQNFEQGLELQRLRAELAASQAKMAQSSTALKQAASEYFSQPR